MEDESEDEDGVRYCSEDEVDKEGGLRGRGEGGDGGGRVGVRKTSGGGDSEEEEEEEEEEGAGGGGRLGVRSGGMESSFMDDSYREEEEEEEGGDGDSDLYRYSQSQSQSQSQSGVGNEMSEKYAYNNEYDNDNDEDEESDGVGGHVQRQLYFNDDNEEDEKEGEKEEYNGYDNNKDDHWRRRDVENPPPQDEEMSRKFDHVPPVSVKRVDSSDSMDDITHSKMKIKGHQDGRTGESRVMAVVNIFWLPSKAWLAEVWRDITFANMSKCGSETKAAFHTLFKAKDTWAMCLHYLLVGLAMSFICEVVNQGPQYNTALLLVLIAGFEFHYFPTNSVRPQLVISVLILMSFVLDIILFAQPPHEVNDAAKVLTSFVFLSKGLALYNFLCLSNTGSRAKKYLWRRIRVFFIPLSYPRKPMREIRSRILAIEWLQGGVAVGYVVLFIFGFTTIGVANVMSSPSAGMPLVAFLPIKFLTSSAITMVLMIDTDITLCFAYFGCLGGMMSYVKAYIHSKQQEYGGWPLSYAFNPYRVYAVACLKFVDVCFGFAGWAAVGTTFSSYYSLGYNVMALVAGTVTVLVLSDIWVPILFYFIIRMIRKHDKLVGRLQESEESDDSELDEFDIRNNEKAIKNGREMRYRNLNQGFMKPFKSKYSVGSSSSEGDDLSSSSDEEEGRRPRKKKKDTMGYAEDDDYSSRVSKTPSLNISVGMAMGDSDDNNNDDEGNVDVDEDNEGEQEYLDEANRLTSPGPLPLRQSRSPAGGLMSPNLMPAAHGWGRHNKVSAASFSPGKGSWGQATSDASQIKKSAQLKVSFEEVGPSTNKHPKPHSAMKLPPLDTSHGLSSPSPTKGRPPFVPKLQLSTVPSPTGPKNNNDNYDSDVEYTFDSPYQPNIRTKTGTPIQKQGLKPLPPVGQPRPPERAKPDNSEGHITIEEATSISPDRYTEMWDEMDVSASFSAQLYPENDIIEKKLVQLVTHLQAENFYVVAAGQADNVMTIYGFASGFKKSTGASNDMDIDGSIRLGVTAVYFLMELKINTDSSLHPQGLWSFECNCKCNSPPSNSVFIKMMLLGDCLRLVKS